MESLDHPFLVGALFGATPILILAIIAWWGRRRKYQRLPSAEGFHVRYCSGSRFQRFWKFFPWEGIGHLKLDERDLLFQAHPNRGEPFTIQVPRENLQLHGRRNWFKNGLLPWLLLRAEPNDYYLCVETGPLIFGADEKTHTLLAAMEEQGDETRPDHAPSG